MGFTNPAAAVTLAPGAVVGVNSAPSGAVPAAEIASAGGTGSGINGTTHIIAAPFTPRYLLVWAQVTLLNLLQGLYETLTIQDTNGGLILGPFYAYGTTGTNTPNAASVQGAFFDLGQYELASDTGVDVVLAGSPGSSAAWSVNIGYTDVHAGFPGHIITA